MSDDCVQTHVVGTPYKIFDHAREQKKGLTAHSLEELINTARTRFAFPADAELKIVLEQDGTEIDDEEYFGTLEGNTNLMILCGDQKWKAPDTRKADPRYIVVDDLDYGSKSSSVKKKVDQENCRVQIGSLISSLHSDPTHLPLLTGTDLEMLSDMDPDSVADIVPDKQFLEQLREASGRFLIEKRQAQESMALLRLFPESNEEADEL